MHIAICILSTIIASPAPFLYSPKSHTPTKSAQVVPIINPVVAKVPSDVPTALDAAVKIARNMRLWSKSTSINDRDWKALTQPQMEQLHANLMDAKQLLLIGEGFAMTPQEKMGVMKEIRLNGNSIAEVEKFLASKFGSQGLQRLTEGLSCWEGRCESLLDIITHAPNILGAAGMTDAQIVKATNILTSAALAIEKSGKLGPFGAVLRIARTTLTSAGLLRRIEQFKKLVSAVVDSVQTTHGKMTNAHKGATGGLIAAIAALGTFLALEFQHPSILDSGDYNIDHDLQGDEWDAKEDGVIIDAPNQSTHVKSDVNLNVATR